MLKKIMIVKSSRHTSNRQGTRKVGRTIKIWVWKYEQIKKRIRERTQKENNR